MASTRNKRHQTKKFLSQLYEFVNDFIIDTDTNADAIGSETSEPHTKDLA